MGKVRALNCVAKAEGMMHVIWYWPKMPRGSTDAPIEWHIRYSSCVHHAWVPSREPDDWVSVSSAMTSWKNTTSTPMCTVHGVQVEKEIKIPRGGFITFFSMHQQKSKLLMTRICEIIRCT